MENILELNNITKHFKGFSLKGVSFSLEKGFIMGFIGPNGAGKTTTIKLIMNLIRKDTGIIKVFGMDNVNNELEIKQRIGFVYDEDHFYEELTGSEMKRIIAPFYRHWDETVFSMYIKRFNVPLNKKIKKLSRGMRKKLSLAFALSHNAQLIIMDEPTAGLDPVFRDEFLYILHELMEDDNKGVLFSTHLTSDLDKIADYVTLINDGRVLYSGMKDSIYEQFAVIKGSKEILDENIKKELIGMRETGYGFEGLMQTPEKGRHVFGSPAVIERPSLEDFMLYMIRGYKNA